ncbi:M15 family metallopeptidase [Nocardia sp. NPDC051832]|uniref:M15 family metallopeptidase n=1 Tax=Nocardia sp. NPDC051832 TaxID=3155673 RepID=UPI0034483499
MIAKLALSAMALPALFVLTAPGAHADQRTAAAAAGTEGLNPALAAAYTEAEASARAEGVTLYINSGYRSYAEQQAMWEDGVATYGSPDEARRWVLPPEESTHVSGQAIDVGPQPGAQWLERNGNRWGLCRIYANEWWHFELATVPGGQCPALRADASEQPHAPAPPQAVPPLLTGSAGPLKAWRWGPGQ